MERHAKASRGCLHSRAVGCLAVALLLESPKVGFGRLDGDEFRRQCNATVGYPSF